MSGAELGLFFFAGHGLQQRSVNYLLPADLDPTKPGFLENQGISINNVVQDLKATGIEPHWCINHGPTTSLYYRDPDGNQIELQIDNFTTQADLDAFFSSGAFAENPIGVEFDPEALLARFERGDPVEELIVQGSA